jgi:hypothetical protein
MPPVERQHREEPWNPRVGSEDTFVSIIRIGLGETKGYNEGYAAIFGTKGSTPAKKPAAAKKPAVAKKPTAAKKPAVAKKTASKKK